MIGAWIRIIFAIILPLVGFAILLSAGWRSHILIGAPLIIGVFVYHVLQVSLFETARKKAKIQDQEKTWIWTLLSIILIGILARGDWRIWVIEQFLLELVGFLGGVALVSLQKMLKDAKEGKRRPIGLILVGPFFFALWSLTPFWISQHPNPSILVYSLFVVALLLSIRVSYIELSPYCLQGKCMESPRKGFQTIALVVWLFVLIGLVFWMHGARN